MQVWLKRNHNQNQRFLYVSERTIDVFPLSDEAHGERSKDSIRGKCTQYLERAEQLKKYVHKKNKKVHSSGGTAHKETKK